MVDVDRVEENSPFIKQFQPIDQFIDVFPNLLSSFYEQYDSGNRMKPLRRAA